MRLKSLFVFILTANVLLVANQTPSQGPAQAGKLKRVSAALAPERVVYEVFASEVAYRERQWRAAIDPSGREYERRERLRAVMGLAEPDYTTWTGIAQQLMTSLESNAKEGDTLLKRQDLSMDEKHEAILSLKQRRDEAIDEAIEKWKTHVGIRFRFIDDRIRQYAAPGIRISDSPPVGSSAVGRTKR